MYIDQDDYRPRTTFDRPGADPKVIVGGFLALLGSHLALPLTFALIFALLAHSRESQPEEVAAVRKLDVIETKFVKLGKPMDPRAMPNRKVKTKATKRREIPPDAPKNPFKRPEQEPTPDEELEDIPEDAEEDILASLGNSAAELAERTRIDYAQEGDPDGIEDGTATREEGDLFLTQLVRFFRRGFSNPPTVEQGSRLRVQVQVQVATDRTVEGFSLVSSSGHADFDQAVRLRLEQAIGTRIPEPPEEVAAEYLGRPITFPMQSQ